MGSALGKLKAGWFRVAHALGRFNTRLLLSLVFVTMFAIINVFMRLFRKDPLRIREKNASTLWLSVDAPSHEDSIVAHRRQF